MTRATMILCLSRDEGFTDIGQIGRADRAWLGRQRRSGQVVSIGWSIFGRDIWGFKQC